MPRIEVIAHGSQADALNAGNQLANKFVKGEDKFTLSFTCTKQAQQWKVCLTYNERFDPDVIRNLPACLTQIPKTIFPPVLTP